MAKIISTETGDILREQIGEHVIRYAEMETFLPGRKAAPFVDAYLILGETAAVLVDCLEHTESLPEMIAQETSLPLSVVLTHGHPDHAGRNVRGFLARGIPVFLAPEDLPILRRETDINKEKIRPLRDGDQFPTGGGSLVCLACPGHTPGSMAVLDPMDGSAFTGDAVGAGMVWYHLAESLPLAACRESERRLKEKLEETGITKLYPGHLHQAGGPLPVSYLSDLDSCIQGILAEKDHGPVRRMRLWGERLPFCESSFGRVRQLWYHPSHLTE